MSQITWEKFDEGFDDLNGGALYVGDDGESFYAAGVTWMDGGDDEYFACIASWEHGMEPYGGFDPIDDIYQAADAYDTIVDSNVAHDIGWFSNMDDAVAAVEETVAEIDELD